MFKHPLLWLGLLLLIGLVAIWDFSPEDLLRPPPEVEQTFPQAYMIQSRTRRFDTEGRLHHQLLSERAEYFQHLPQRASERDYSLIRNPDITVYGQLADVNSPPPDTGTERPPPWRLSANEGRSNDEGERIHLWGEVRAWRRTEAGLTELTTPELYIEPARQFAETDKAVKMRSPQGQNRAVGMRADLGQDHIELLSEVHGTYEPHNRDP